MTTDPTLYSYGERRDYVRSLSKMTRAQFDALPEADRERILSRLRFVVDRADTRTVRDSMGCTIRGAGAAHTSTARTLLRVFTETHAPAPDNSTAGRLTRYTEATTYHQASEAIRRATKVQMIDICRAVGLYHSPSWKNDKFTRVLLERFGNGDPVDPIGPLAAPGDRVAASVDGGPEVWTGTVTGWETGEWDDSDAPVRVWVRWDHDGSSTDLHRATLTVLDPGATGDQADTDPETTDATHGEPAAVLNEPLSSDYARMGATRVAFRTQPVTVVGNVPFEPGMIRVRLSNGTVRRTLREYVTLTAPAQAATDADAAYASPWSTV